jgi:hypothetical protein
LGYVFVISSKTIRGRVPTFFQILRKRTLSWKTHMNPLRRGVLDATLCDKVRQWLATGQWFSPCTPVSFSNKTDRHDITEILLKVALNTINQTKPINSVKMSSQINMYLFGILKLLFLLILINNSLCRRLRNSTLIFKQYTTVHIILFLQPKIGGLNVSSAPTLAYPIIIIRENITQSIGNRWLGYQLKLNYVTSSLEV